MRLTPLFCALILLAASFPVHAADEARLLRFPDIHDGRIAFVYAGDIWTVDSAGGAARRLTADDGLELFPKFSPDGSRIAFSAEYGGNRQVYVMDVDGGEPIQLTFYNDVGPMPPRGGFDNQVLDWTPDGKQVVFRANRLPWGPRMGRPYLVPVDGGMPTPLAVPESGGGMLSPDGKQFVYTPISREFRTWKRYRGGRAQDVWIFDLDAIEARQLTDDDATDNQPVWVGETIYFTSDREGRLNLYASDTAGGTVRAVTKHQDFDVLWPSAGPKQVVYESGGYLYRLDPTDERAVKVRVEIGGDFLQIQTRHQNVRSNIRSVDLSPSAKRAVFGARGDLFTVPAEHGAIRNISNSSGVREISPVWSPDGRTIAYLSDRSGEYEIWLRDQDGSGEERRITRDGDIWRFAPVWSPDGTKLAFGDKRQRLRYAEIDSGKVVDVDRSATNDITDYAWSPDSRWLVYTKVGASAFSSIFVHSIEERETSQLTADGTNDYSPVFDSGGRYLYFLSDRDYNLTFSGYEFNYLYTRPARIYAATLNNDAPPLLLPRTDEEEPAADDEGGAGDSTEDAGDESDSPDDESEDDAGEPVILDVEGFTDRIVALPGPSGNYASLSSMDDALLYLVTDADGTTSLGQFKLEDEESETILEGVAGYVLSRDGERVLYRTGADYGIVKRAAGQESSAGRLDLSGMTMKIEPAAEWQQIYDDGWRIARDWFYDPGLHGADWPAMRKLYQQLVPSLVHRGDLDFILGELGGELNAGHFYVNWGDMPRPERIDNGLLGAELEADRSGYFKIAKIFRGENWHPEFRSPLTESGVDVSEGEFILAVEGRPTNEVDNVYRLLENSAGRLIRLTVNSEPKSEGAREVSVRPIAAETGLRYLDWVASRRERVEELSGGRIGYIHLPNTATDGNRELRKYFYALAHKEALILDVRYNGGGFIPDRMIELLARTQLNFWKRRGLDPTPTPGNSHVGPKACLINAYSSSGGDAFPYYFRKLGLGPLIGSRTWGGLIGLSGNPGFTDGGNILVPTFRFLDTGGEWAVENVGVVPDIEVLDRPDLVARGEDPTLEKAVEVLLEELERDAPEPVKVPDAPRYKR